MVVVDLTIISKMIYLINHLSNFTKQIETIFTKDKRFEIISFAVSLNEFLKWILFNNICYSHIV